MPQPSQNCEQLKMRLSRIVAWSTGLGNDTSSLEIPPSTGRMYVVPPGAVVTFYIPMRGDFRLCWRRSAVRALELPRARGGSWCLVLIQSSFPELISKCSCSLSHIGNLAKDRCGPHHHERDRHKRSENSEDEWRRVKIVPGRAPQKRDHCQANPSEAGSKNPRRPHRRSPGVGRVLIP